MMNESYAYTSAIWPPILTALFLLALAVYGRRRRRVPGARPFVASCLFTAVWAVSIAFQYAALSVGTKAIWLRFGVMWSLPAVTAVTCFILEYTWPGRWLTRRNLFLLSLAPLLFMLLLLTEESSYLVIRDYFLEGDRIIAQLNSGAWVFLAYSYLLGVINIGVLAWLFAHSAPQRWPAVLMIAGQIINRLIYTRQVARPAEFDLPLNLPFLLLPYLVYAVALFAFRILDPMAIVRQTAVDQLDSGLLVMDHAGRIVGLNPAAERIFGLPVARARNRPATELLPAEALVCREGHETDERMLQLGGPPERDYLLEASLLRDWRGLEVGRLLLLHDVTEQRQAQAQLLAQQRVLATLQERERLARELHDSAGQILGYVSLQAQAIQKHVRDGNPATAEAQLARLAEMAAAAHTDVRESILSLKVGQGSPCFLAALGQHLRACEAQYGFATELIIKDGLDDDDFAPDTTVQLLRVVAEALTNVRKHGRAERVLVTLTREGSGARITIEDNGCGFDLNAGDNGAIGHFGLTFMRERMAQVGGRLIVDSRPGTGTQLVLSVPLDAEQELQR